MPIDGTYGRLSAHNQRFKELRRKKLQRREDKLWRNSMKHIQRNENEIQNYLDTISPEKLEELKFEIHKKAKKALREELYIFILSVILTSILVYFLIFYYLN